jgi:hypothetical protein
VAAKKENKDIRADFITNIMKDWKDLDDAFMTRRLDKTEKEKLYDYIGKHFTEAINKLDEFEQLFYVAIGYYAVVTNNPKVMLDTARYIMNNKDLNDELRQLAAKKYSEWLKASYIKVQ